VPIRRGIDLAIRRGEFLAIMGLSGSGKSTLMNLTGCLDRPTGGDVHVSGKDVSKLSEAELAHLRGQEIGFVFQTFNLASGMSAFQNVELPAIVYHKHGCNPKKRAKELLELVGLAGRMHHKPTELSGGQHQRVALAMARSQHPDSASSQFYICDGAQSFLDGQYAVFGRTIEGIDVVRAIAEVKTGPQDKPVKSVAITGISIK
jgi:putative ABC transport system ATP-binding protein